MNARGQPVNSSSSTPRVDKAERFMYAIKREPVGFVLSSFAKRLELELNQALAELETRQPVKQAGATAQGPASKPVAAASIPTAEVSAGDQPKNVAQSKTTVPNPQETAANKGKPSSAIDNAVDSDDDDSGPPPQIIKPSKTPEGAGDSVEYEDGQVLFNKGDKANHLAIVLEGSVEIFDPVGNIKLAVLGPGSSFGEQAILEGGIRGASVKASGKVKCLEIKAEPIRNLLKNDAGILLQTIEGLLLQLGMCNHISKMIATPGADLVYELLGDETLTSIQLQRKLNDAYKNPDSHGLSAEQMMYLKLQSSERLMSNWFESGKTLASPEDDHPVAAYVIAEGSVDAKCGNRVIRLGHGSVLGLAEGITGAPFTWTLVANNHLTVKAISLNKVLRGLERTNAGIRGIVRYTTSRILELQKGFNN